MKKLQLDSERDIYVGSILFPVTVGDADDDDEGDGVWLQAFKNSDNLFLTGTGSRTKAYLLTFFLAFYLAYLPTRG